MKEKLKAAMKDAMKAKDKVRLDTIRGLLSAIQYEEMQKKVDSLPKASTVALLQTECKKRRESLEFAEKDGREDMIAGIKQEIQVIEEFLPAQLSENELEEIISEIKDSSPDVNMGAVMKALKEQYSGQYDGKTASSVAKRVLG